MAFFNLFSRPDVDHPQLGRLQWRHGQWIGAVNDLGVRLHGDKSGPSPADTALLIEAIANLEILKSVAAHKIFEHYLGYKETDDSGLIFGTEDPFPDIHQPNAVWQQTSDHVLRVGAHSDPRQVELCFRVAWDIEHTLGALFLGTELIELSGSVALPRT